MSQETCAVVGCDAEAQKMVGRRYIQALQGLNLRIGEVKGAKIHLCKKHYKLAKDAMRALKRPP